MGSKSSKDRYYMTTKPHNKNLANEYPNQRNCIYGPPWHLADIWYDLVVVNSEQELNRFDIEVTIDKNIGSNYNLYIAPIGLLKLNNISLYGGIQTNTLGYKTKSQLPNQHTNIGYGGIFSRWSSKKEEPIGLDYIEMFEDGSGLCESDSYEGQFCSVRRSFQWKKGTYTFSLVKENTIQHNKTDHTWFSLQIQNNFVIEPAFIIGRLLFEGNRFKIPNTFCSFVEIYGNSYEVPQVEVTFSNIKVNGIQQTVSNINAFRDEKTTPNCSDVYPVHQNGGICVSLTPTINLMSFTHKKLK